MSGCAKGGSEIKSWRERVPPAKRASRCREWRVGGRSDSDNRGRHEAIRGTSVPNDNSTR